MKTSQPALEKLGAAREDTGLDMCRLGSENTRPTGGRQEHAPNPSRPQPTAAGKGLTGTLNWNPPLPPLSPHESSDG